MIDKQNFHNIILYKLMFEVVNDWFA
jgi:hypothetical protein